MTVPINVAAIVATLAKLPILSSLPDPRDPTETFGGPGGGLTLAQANIGGGTHAGVEDGLRELKRLWKMAEAHVNRQEVAIAAISDDICSRLDNWTIANSGVAYDVATDPEKVKPLRDDVRGFETTLVMLRDELRRLETAIGAIDSRLQLPSPDSTAPSTDLDPLGGPNRPVRIQLKRAEIPDTPDTSLWLLIRESTEQLSFDSYAQFMDAVLCGDGPPSGLVGTEEDVRRARKQARDKMRLPFPDVDAYRFLKASTEVFMMLNCGVCTRRGYGVDGVECIDSSSVATIATDSVEYGRRRGVALRDANDINRRLTTLVRSNGTPFPYLELIRNKLQDVPISDFSRRGSGDALTSCHGIIREKLTFPCLLELIWSYWHEEGMLVQSMNAITRRFQNIRAAGERDPLALFEIDPLRPLNNFLWGYIQDEQHRLTVVRRAYEYDHHYGLPMLGKAVPGVKGADSRSRFIEAFHNLLHVCLTFYKEDDDTTVIADGFSVLNALREVHLILSQGAHNQFGDLPWTARQEMLMQEWILSRPEMREFLPTRIMVAYPEPWMDRVDAMKTIMGWGDTSVLHFRELGIFGERILLGARFNDWTRVIEPERASNWARFWRPEVQGYVHAYRAATGVDMTERAESTMPSTLLQRRMAAASQRVPVR